MLNQPHERATAATAVAMRVAGRSATTVRRWQAGYKKARPVIVFFLFSSAGGNAKLRRTYNEANFSPVRTDRVIK